MEITGRRLDEMRKSGPTRTLIRADPSPTKPKVGVTRWIIIGVIVFAVGSGIALLIRAMRDEGSPPRSSSATKEVNGTAEPRYVGRAVCGECHKVEEHLWNGSHHALAMQPATEQTVLGDFGDATFTYFDVTSAFFRREGKFFVRTDGADGNLHEFEIVFTFGIDPLQQYLIAFPDGRMQALNVCWDTRPKEAGGQRWFHLYPNERIPHDDILHWTGPYQNWNHMCAECHSTDVHKNYDVANNSFSTSWSEINVSCEACHGPGSEHFGWAKAVLDGGSAQAYPHRGLLITLKEPQPPTWVFERDATTAKPNPPRTFHVEAEMCARCHSRRGTFSEDYVTGRPLMDTHRPSLLEPTLFEFDGQIKDEVYEYQSFLQSKMYAAGVTCTDCHNPHSLKMPSGNAVCASCHLAERFDTPLHHFHAAGSAGSLCLNCHAPAKNYMVVHARHDHSFRIPRPSLTLKIGVPNACNQCHTDRTTQWAADATIRWWAPNRSGDLHIGERLAAGHRGLPGAERILTELIDDATKPAIVRASAAALLGDVLGSVSLPTLARALQDREPMIRATAVDALRAVDPASRAGLAAPLLTDPVRMVRIDAARALAATPQDLFTRELRAALRHGLDEYRRAQLVDADRAEAHLNLGALSVDLGQLDEAEHEYQTAIKLSPRFPMTYVNLADLYRLREQDDLAERTLRDGLALSPNDANLHHALGLTLARQKNLDNALSQFALAADLAPDNARYAYVWGVALHSTGQGNAALNTLRVAHERKPNDREILTALALFSRDAGDTTSAIEFARKLVDLDSTDMAARQLLEELRSSD